MRALEIQHTEDPGTRIAREIGDVSWFELVGPTLLVAQYNPGSQGHEVKTKGGIIIANTEEWNYQGKVGFVLSVGPLAFQDSDDGRYKFSGRSAKVGQWVVYRTSDGMQMMLDQHLCRVLQDVHVIAVIPQPDRVY